MVVGDEGHDADVDCAERVGRWVDVDLACPISCESKGAKSEDLPRREAAGG